MPKRIYNVDESGFPLDPKRIKVLLELPSNSTHILQPLVVGVYGLGKTEWEKILRKFAWQNLRIALSKELFPMLLKQLRDSDSLSASNIQAGFKKCGIMPFNPAKIPATFFESAEFLDTLYKPNIQSQEPLMTRPISPEPSRPTSGKQPTLSPNTSAQS